MSAQFARPTVPDEPRTNHPLRARSLSEAPCARTARRFQSSGFGSVLKSQWHQHTNSYVRYVQSADREIDSLSLSPSRVYSLCLLPLLSLLLLLPRDRLSEMSPVVLPASLVTLSRLARSEISSDLWSARGGRTGFGRLALPPNGGA